MVNLNAIHVIHGDILNNSFITNDQYDRTKIGGKVTKDCFVIELFNTYMMIKVLFSGAKGFVANCCVGTSGSCEG